MKNRQGVLLGMSGDLHGVRPTLLSSARLKAGLQLLASGTGLNAFAGEPSNAFIRLRWLRKLVLGDMEGGGFIGRLNTTAGVEGLSSFSGDEEKREPRPMRYEKSLLGLSKEELRMRAISASARPLFMR